MFRIKPAAERDGSPQCPWGFAIGLPLSCAVMPPSQGLSHKRREGRRSLLLRPNGAAAGDQKAAILPLVARPLKSIISAKAVVHLTALLCAAPGT
jgi:hypothetical protein